MTTPPNPEQLSNSAKSSLGSLYDTDTNFISGAAVDLTFPPDLGTKIPYYITFQFSQYKRRSIFENVFTSAVGNIRLPIPNNLVDSFSVTYSDSEGMNAAAGAILENTMNAVNGDNSTAAKIAGSIASGTLGAFVGGGLGLGLGTIKSLAATADPTVKGGFAKAVGQKAIAAITEQAINVSGLAINPFLAVMFKSPEFKRHTFRWKFSPSSPQESAIIDNIVNKFKYHMLPSSSRASGGTLLAWPDIVEISLQNALPQESNYLYRFKPAVVESFSVNYAPDSPVFFDETHAPGSILIEVRLLETLYWLKSDIRNSLNRPISTSAVTRAP